MKNRQAADRDLLILQAIFNKNNQFPVISF
jgi:hypothetical protein